MFNETTLRKILLSSLGYFTIMGEDDGKSISQNVSSLKILVHDITNLLYYEEWTGKRNCFSIFGFPTSTWKILTATFCKLPL